MRRDIGNELVVAIAAVGVLAFALIFGVILSLSSTPSSGTTTPATGTSAPTLNPTEMSEMSQLSTQVVALLTASAQPEALTTEVVSETVAPSATTAPTEEEASNTATQRATSTRSEISATPTATFTASAASTVEATNTSTRTPRPTDTAEPTDTPTRTPTQAASNTPRPTNTRTSVPTESTASPSPNVSGTFEVLRASASAFAERTNTPTIAPSNTSTRSRTPRPTNTTEPTDTSTRTPAASNTTRPSSTSEPSETNTSRPTNTRAAANAASPTPTNTLEPTDTSTRTPSRTATHAASNTPQPTNTPDPTSPLATLTPSSTLTATATNTVPPSTNTPTLTQTPTYTRTIAPSYTVTVTSTRTAAQTAMGTFVLPTAIVLSGNVPIPTVLVIGTPATPTECTLPQGWTIYVVQPGDTLFRIALAVNSTVGELRDANCLQNVDNILAMTELFVPRAPAGPLPTLPTVNLPQVIPALQPLGCSNAGSLITVPAPGQAVTGVFTVFGTATVNNFQFYRIEVRPDSISTYNFYSRVETPVVNNALAQINSDLFDDGLYWVRLTVVDNTGNFTDPCTIPLIFR